MEISEEEYRKLQLYKHIVEDAVRNHIATVFIAEKMKKEIEIKMEKIKP